MIRLIFVGFLIYTIVKVFRRLSRDRSPQYKVEKNETGEMVSCCRCGTFVLKSDALEKKGQFYCNKTCLN